MSTSVDIREELVTVLRELTRARPDIPFGEIVGDLAYEADGHTDSPLIGDQALLDAARRLRDDECRTGHTEPLLQALIVVAGHLVPRRVVLPFAVPGVKVIGIR